MSWLTPEFVQNFHFLRPLFLLGLLPVFLLVIAQLYLQQSQSSWNKAIAPELLPYLLDRSSTPKKQYPLYGLLFIWLLACVALAGPVWQQIPVPVQEKEDTMVIVQDMSLSMYSNDLRPNRLTRAQRKLIDVLNVRKEEGQTALVVYAGDAHTVTPLTDDIATINNMVSALTPDIMPMMGSKPEAGITLALELLENSNITEAQILLITDGINRSDISPIETLLEDTNFSLLVLGVGTADGAPIPMEDGGFLRDQQNAIVIPRLQRNLLQDLAGAAGGLYTDIQLNDSDLNYLLTQNLFDENGDLIESDRESDRWDEAGPWLLLLALPFAAFAFRRGWVLSIALLVMSLPHQQAYAWEWNEFWNNADQRGSQTFVEEDFQQAAELFEDSAWRAAANYKNGNYEQALADLAQQNDVDSVYNTGNALAKLNRYEEASNAYAQVLEQEPEHADARRNKEIVEQLLQEQEQQEQEQQQSNSGENEEQEQQDSEQQQQQEEGEQQQEQDQQQDQSEQSGEQQEQEQETEAQQQESTESEEGDESEQEDSQSAEESQLSSEEEQAMQQYLNRIEDNPGELLRNKFRYQYQQRLYEQFQNPNSIEQQAEQQIW